MAYIIFNENLTIIFSIVFSSYTREVILDTLHEILGVLEHLLPHKVTKARVHRKTQSQCLTVVVAVSSVRCAYM